MSRKDLLMVDKTGEKRVLILLGPTAVGKTGASILLARRLGTEIISADSMQIYRGMDIGTAKPGPAEMKEVPHHMIDILEPSERFSAGKYVEAVREIIDRLHRKGKVPLIVGGTGLYIKALTRGIFPAPGADHALREHLLREERESPGSLYRRLEEVDPGRAEELSPLDTRRVVRALEVVISTGRRMTELIREKTIPLSCDYIKIGLTRERDELYRIIERRVEDMFEAGLLNEVRALLQRNPSETPLQAIGYKEVIRYLEGEMDYPGLLQEVKKATRRYAKRQFTWFRKEEGIRWIDITGIYEPEEILERILQVREVRELL